MNTATLFLYHIQQLKEHGISTPTNAHSLKNTKLLQIAIEDFCLSQGISSPRVLSHFWSMRKGAFQDIEIYFDDSLAIISDSGITAHSLPEKSTGGTA